MGTTEDAFVTGTGWGWDGAQATLGGALVRVAGPVVHEFHSDLYRDMQVVAGLDEGEHVLTYVVRETGTHLIVRDQPSLVAIAEQGWKWRATWRLTLRRDRTEGSWLVSARRLRQAGLPSRHEQVVVRDLPGLRTVEGDLVDALLVRPTEGGHEVALHDLVSGRWLAPEPVQVSREEV